MAAVGSAALVVALLTSLYAVGVSLAGATTGRRHFVESGRWAIYALAGLLVLAFVILEAAYLRSDLRFALVAESSSSDTPTFYKATAMWATQAGSLLLWVFLLSLFAAAVLHLTRRSLREIVPWATAVMGTIAAFFLFLMVVYESPFDTLAAPPAEGAGLNPLLRHPMMMFHPPLLYSGYVGFSIPFAFAIGALVTRRTGADWIRATRRFALVAWTFLAAGLLLGSLWGYSELGWGGYWGWDPVENAALLPWLTGTAFLHSIIVQEKRGMLRVWNVSLIVATFVLALTGTFLVRSGILDSIHAFGASTLGKPFLVFIACVVFGSTALVLSRRGDLRSRARLGSLLSREAFFVLNNLVLVGLAFVVLWGTFFPLVSEALTGRRASVGPPWFDRYTTPLALVLALLAGVGPTLTWRAVSAARLLRILAFPAAAAATTLLVLVLASRAPESPLSLATFSLVAFTLTCVAQEFWRGARARAVTSGRPRPVALFELVARNRRRYGGYIVHAGIALLFLGTAASSAFKQQTDVRLRPGESAAVGDYRVTYREATARLADDPAGTGAPITLGAVLELRDGSDRFELRPARNYYPGGDPSLGPIGRFFEGNATSEVSQTWGLDKDVWTAVQPDLTALQRPIRVADRRFGRSPGDVQALVIAALTDRYTRLPGEANFRLIVFPLVGWIYIGGAVALLGGLLALWPAPEARLRRIRSAYAARLRGELAGS
jgi:cytochrome c-type biogenesis protein CcmF